LMTKIRIIFKQKQIVIAVEQNYSDKPTIWKDKVEKSSRWTMQLVFSRAFYLHRSLFSFAFHFI
jgi:hypothetical protein